MFSADPTPEYQLLHVVPNLSAEIDNSLLEAVPSIEEVRKVVFDMDGKSTARLDLFTGKFFTFAWEVIAQDVYQAVVSFFCGAELPRFVTSTSIVLIPKVASPRDFTQFRPISVCNFLSKIISRILVGRLSGILPRISSPQHSGFVKGRMIADNYFLAQELFLNWEESAEGEIWRLSWIWLRRMIECLGYSLLVSCAGLDLGKTS